MIVPKRSAILEVPNEGSIALNGNHTEITKFSSKEDNNFERVSGILAIIVSKIRQDSMMVEREKT